MNTIPSHRQTIPKFIPWLLVLLLSACGQPLPTLVQPGPVNDRPGGPAPVWATTTVERETAPAVTPAELDELVDGNTAFALDLYQAIRESEGNLAYSPYSISTALAMTYAGARNETERQMAATLHYTLPQERLHPAFNALDLELDPTNAIDATAPFTLSVANSLWGQQDYPFRQEFVDLLARHYGSGLALVDFVDPAGREVARRTINGWVADETAGKITDLIGKGIFTDLTRLVLVNAIYLNAKWDVPFLNGTKEAPFQLLNGDSVTVPLMSRRAQTAYAAGPDFQAVDLTYQGERLHMLVLLPEAGQFAAFEDTLDRDRLADILAALEPHDVKLYLPRFETGSTLDLSKTLAEMGMPDAFEPKADFSGMDATTYLLLAYVLHQAVIAVDELGTEAAAATAVVAEIESMPLEVRVDRPFIFLIRDRHSGTILFMGRVVNPLG